MISITRSLDGIVASSQVSETQGGSTANLELTIPTRNLDAALDQMTDLANVDSLNETTDDITKPFVSAQDQVHDAKARRHELLKALGNATTDAEAEALTIQIADARREISRAEANFDRIARKARLSDLNVTVSSNPNASDERTLGDWFDDAVDVLRGVAGVLLVSAAILIPIGLIAAIVAWVAMRLRRRSREKTLALSVATAVEPRAEPTRTDSAPSAGQSCSKSDLRAPQTGQNQLSGMSTNSVPAGIPPSGSPSAGS